MVRLAIRDDDMNFFTKVEDVEYVYRDFNNFPVSFAVIPAVKDISTKGACPETRGNDEPKDLGNNVELVKWLKKKLHDKKADVLLHGINHDYKFLNGKRYAEMEWRDGQMDLFDVIKTQKKYLESLLDYKIGCFVAPSNKISKYCLNMVVKNGMNFSGIVPITFERNWTFRNFYNYAKRWWYRVNSSLPWPGVLKYSDHLEINACQLQSYVHLRKMFDFCKNHSLPMVINVHYWHLRDNPEELEVLRSFVMEYAIPQGAIPSTVSQIMEDDC